MSNGPIERRSNLEVIYERIKRRVTGGSGQAQEAGRRISGRQRQIDRQVEEQVRGRRRDRD